MLFASVVRCYLVVNEIVSLLAFDPVRLGLGPFVGGPEAHRASRPVLETFVVAGAVRLSHRSYLKGLQYKTPASIDCTLAFMSP